MPRPRRDSEILPAKERLENAFWELLSEREYRKITVTDIVRTADVNRNSFYYHFTGLPELADSAILHAVENTPLPSAPNANFNPDNEWRKHVTALLREPEQRRRLDRLALLAGPHSSPELVESLQDFGRLTLISVLGLDADHLDLKTDLMLDFTVGGMLAVLRRWPKLHLDCSKVCGREIASEYTGRMRCSVILLGALLGRNQRGVIGYPGGCVIGKLRMCVG